MRRYELYFETINDNWDPKEVREKLREAWLEPSGRVFDRHRELIQRLGLLLGKPGKTPEEIMEEDGLAIFLKRETGLEFSEHKELLKNIEWRGS